MLKNNVSRFLVRRTLFTDMIRPNRNREDQNEQAQDYGPKAISEVSPSILLKNGDFCVIDKPHNVRMNGDFPVTVEKLVSSWLSLDPIALKWVHQLDHATSGTLCIALNKRAAAIASRSFVLRQVKKEYLAVLEGHLQMSSFPILEEESIGKLRDVFKSSLSLQQEIEGKKNTAEELPSKVPWTKRQRVDSPAQSSAGNVCSTQETSWQDEVKSANLRKCWDAFVELQNGIGNFRDNATVATLYNSLSSKSYQEFERNAKIRKNLRKLLKLCGKDLDLDPSQGEALPSAQAGADGNLISLDDLDVSEWRERYGNDSIDIGKQANNDLESIGGSISSVYRLTGDSPPNSILSSIQPSHDRLLILVPIRDSLSNDFRMIPTKLSRVGESINNCSDNQRSLGKYCETILRVVDYTYWNGKPVTKVLLNPRTGRRHQLRVHSACIGHPIVGDYTYNLRYRLQQENETELVIPCISAEQSTSSKLVVADDRMMLHALSLKIPLPPDEVLSKRYRGGSSTPASTEALLIQIESQDPFPIQEK